MTTPRIEPFDFTDPADREALERLSRARVPDEPVRHREPADGLDMIGRAVRTDDGLAAYLDCGQLPGIDDADTYHLWILVHPDHSRHGLGRAMLAQARAHAVAAGRSRLLTAVNDADDIARSWLQSEEFESLGRIVHLLARPTGNRAEGVTTYRNGQEDLPAEVAEAIADQVTRRVMPGGASRPTSGQDVLDWFASGDNVVTRLDEGSRVIGLATFEPDEDDDHFVDVFLLDGGEDAGGTLYRDASALAGELGSRAVNAAVYPDDVSGARLHAAATQAGYTMRQARAVWSGPVARSTL